MAFLLDPELELQQFNLEAVFLPLVGFAGEEVAVGVAAFAPVVVELEIEVGERGVDEAAVLFGLLVWFSDRGARTEELLLFIAVTGSILVSYVRARAEVIGLKMREGVFTRTERVVIISAGLLSINWKQV